MEASWLHKDDRNKLIVFCNGWGMDGTPFRSLTSSQYDVYMLYDYRMLPSHLDLQGIIEPYAHVMLVSWSMGVWVGQKLFGRQGQIFHRTIAINGTLCPIDDRYGIPTRIFNATLAEYNSRARRKFYQRMCREKKTFTQFLSNQPQRTLEDQAEELAALQSIVTCLPVEKSIYNEIIISENDMIVPSINQYNYWQGRRVMVLRGFHFPFYSVQSWDHLLGFSDALPKG